MSKALVDNAGDPQQVRAARKKERYTKLQQDADWKAVLDTAQGRRVLWHIMEQCKMFESIWEQSSRIYYNAGQQDIGHIILARVLEAHPVAYIEMLQNRLQEDMDNA